MDEILKILDDMEEHIHETFYLEMISDFDAEYQLKKINDIREIAKRPFFNIFRAAELIKHNDTKFALQIIKSKLSGQPSTAEISGDLVVRLE